jgi:hypothetical protein
VLADKAPLCIKISHRDSNAGNTHDRRFLQIDTAPLQRKSVQYRETDGRFGVTAAR